MRMEQIQRQVNQMLQKGSGSATGTSGNGSQASHHTQQHSHDAGQQHTH